MWAYMAYMECLGYELCQKLVGVSALDDEMCVGGVSG